MKRESGRAVDPGSCVRGWTCHQLDDQESSIICRQDSWQDDINKTETTRDSACHHLKQRSYPSAGIVVNNINNRFPGKNRRFSSRLHLRRIVRSSDDFYSSPMPWRSMRKLNTRFLPLLLTNFLADSHYSFRHDGNRSGVERWASGNKPGEPFHVFRLFSPGDMD